MSAEAGSPSPSPWRRRALLGAPLVVAAGAGLGFWAMLRGLRSGDYDPHGVPSALIGKPVPDFALPAPEGSTLPAFSAADLHGNPGPVLVNFFASWCVPCIVEHPQLMALQRQGVAVWGVAYKDRPADALGFLARRGNPFARLAEDQPGRVAIEWGLYGVPETYLVDRQGIIRWRWAGPITEDTLRADLTPLLRQYST